MEKVTLIADQDLERRLKACLERRSLPDCFLYVGSEGAERWLGLDRSDEFPIASRLTELLRAHLDDLTALLPDRVDLASIGVGDGAKERLIAEALGARRCAKCCLVDVSSRMVDAAMETLSGLDVACVGVVGLCEDLPRLSAHWGSPALLCLLGNNFSNYEPDFLLGLVAGQLGGPDRFLFDCHLGPEGDDAEWRRQVERAYRSARNVAFNLAPLLRRGVPREACEWHIELVRVETPVGQAWRTRKRIDILRDAVVHVAGDEVPLRAGESIAMGFTYKLTAPQVDGFLARHGLQQVAQFRSPDAQNILTLARKAPPGEA